MPSDLEKCGATLRRLRTSRGITQKEVINRVGSYSDESSYRKVERGVRKPERRTLIELAINGVLERRISVVDELLALAGYEGLSEAEIEEFSLKNEPQSSAQNHPDATTSLPSESSELFTDSDDTDFDRSDWLILSSVILASIVAAVLLSSLSEPLPQWFVITTSILYASLYLVSVFLETAYQKRSAQVAYRGVVAFCLVLLTSISALVLDGNLARAGRGIGLWLALAIFLVIAVTQWILVRPVLPASSIVKAKFEPHSAQAAHLKNTSYFLLLVVLFWLPTAHFMAASGSPTKREALAKHLSIPGDLGLAGGSFYPKPEWMWAILLLMIAVALPMGSHLLDNLEPHSRRNLYLNLFYMRLILYFALSAICLIWYSTVSPIAPGALEASEGNRGGVATCFGYGTKLVISTSRWRTPTSRLAV